MDKIVKDDTPRYAIKQDLKEVLHDRKIATETERHLKEKEAKRLALEKAKILQTEKEAKEKEAKRLALGKAQIEALINKHKPQTPKTPDEVNTLGTGKNANIDGKEGTKKGKPPHKKATKASQIKMSQNKGDKSHEDKSDTLLGDPITNTKNSTNKAKVTKPKEPIGIDDIGVFDGTKPETSKQHYERFNLYINFQTKSGHLTDPVGEAIDLFKHTLDKTALVWFQMNRSKLKDLTTLKTMFLK